MDGKDDVGEGSSRDGVRGSLVGAGGGGGGGGGDVTDARGGKFPCCPKPCCPGACCLEIAGKQDVPSQGGNAMYHWVRQMNLPCKEELRGT